MKQIYEALRTALKLIDENIEPIECVEERRKIIRAMKKIKGE